MTVLINPGSGPVADADETNAVRNMLQMLSDVYDQTGVLFLAHRLPGLDREGRYGFLLFRTGSTETHEIDMPGLPLERVRWLGPDTGDIYDFPRLYVDGSSWIWYSAMRLFGPQVP